MSKPRSRVVIEYAMKLLGEGKRTPTIAQLFKCLNNGKPKNRQEIVSLLRATRRGVERIYDLPTCPLSECFYESFQKKPPKSEEEAKKCLPGGGGQGNRIAGLYFPRKGKENLIFKTFCDRYGKQGANLVGISKERVERGIRHKLLPGNSLQEMMPVWLAFIESTIEQPMKKLMTRVKRLENQLR